MKKIIPLILLGFLLTCYPAIALDLHSAKAQGKVGETATGYLAPVSGGADVKNLVNSINAKRKQVYVQISKRNKTPIGAVEKLAGKKAMAKTPAGQFIQVNGAWKKK